MFALQPVPDSDLQLPLPDIQDFLYCRIIFLIQGAGVLYQALDYGYDSDSKTLIVQAVGLFLTSAWQIRTRKCDKYCYFHLMQDFSYEFAFPSPSPRYSRVLPSSILTGLCFKSRQRHQLSSLLGCRAQSLS